MECPAGANPVPRVVVTTFSRAEALPWCDGDHQRRRQLPPGGHAEFLVDLSQVIVHGVRTEDEPSAISAFVAPSAANRATACSWVVSRPLPPTANLRSWPPWPPVPRAPERRMTRAHVLEMLQGDRQVDAGVACVVSGAAIPRTANGSERGRPDPASDRWPMAAGNAAQDRASSARIPASAREHPAPSRFRMPWPPRSAPAARPAPAPHARIGQMPRRGPVARGY